jgi:hypothetical protein
MLLEDLAKGSDYTDQVYAAHACRRLLLCSDFLPSTILAFTVATMT